MIKLGVNIDHVATLRQARGEKFPNVLDAALDAIRGGANGITAHLREDRRHIQDRDILELKRKISVPLNMEMAATPELIRIASRVKPAWACLVPEKRHELTTEGGLDVGRRQQSLAAAIKKLNDAGTWVSLFVEPSMDVVRLARRVGAQAVELHTGLYARTWHNKKARLKELDKIRRAAIEAHHLNLKVNAGHGLTYDNVADLVTVFPFNEFNIGFSIVARAVFVGLEKAVREMKRKI